MSTFPVVEVFGPTVQGEGPLAGVRTHFVRFGLCDYRCVWCDSMYAVDPKLVRANAERMDEDAIVTAIGQLGEAPWVTLSGGNPAIHDLGRLVDDLQERELKVAVETQGSLWREWLRGVDQLVVSPKPPSSGMFTGQHDVETSRFMAQLRLSDAAHVAIKVVVFDEDDLDYAVAFASAYPHYPLFLSVGTDPPQEYETDYITRAKVGDRYRWLIERVCERRIDATVLPQLHVLAFGHARGV